MTLHLPVTGSDRILSCARTRFCFPQLLSAVLQYRDPLHGKGDHRRWPRSGGGADAFQRCAPCSTGGLLIALVIQIVLGALIGFVVQLFVGAVQGAGALVDQFSGLNLPPALDPLSLDHAPLLARLYEWIATVLIFVSGADLLLAQGFIRSFSVIGTTIPERDIKELPTFLSADLVAFFAAAAEIAAPLVAVVLAAQLLLGLLAKSAPQANVYALGFPLQLLLVIGGLGLAAVALPSDVANLVERGLTQLFGAA